MIFITSTYISTETKKLLESIKIAKPIIIPKIEEIKSILSNQEELLKENETIIIDGLLSNEFAINTVDWLRIKFKILSPIVIIGKSALGSLFKESIHYTFFSAPGNYYFQIESEKLHTFLQHKPILSGISSINDIKPYIINRFDISDMRHSEANVFGLKTLFDIQHLISKPNKSEKLIYPDELKNSIDNLKYYALEIIFPPISNSKKIGSFIDKVKEDLELKLYSLSFDSEYSDFTIEDILEFKESYEQELIALEESITTLKNYNQLDGIEDYQQKASSVKLEIENVVIELAKRKSEQTDSIELDWSNTPEFKSVKIETKNKKVLLIDDQANIGWGEVYKRILNLESIDIIEPKDRSTIEDIFSQIDLKLKSKSFDILLLDLMLLEDEKNSLNHNLSGFQALRFIKKKYPFIPVIVTSASNKLWSYKQVINSGGYAYWMKEGIDSLFDYEYSLKNYNELILTFNRIINNKEFQILKTLNQFYYKLNDSNFKAWWTNPNFNYPTKEVNFNAKTYTITNSIQKRNIINVKRTYRNALNVYKSIIIESLEKRSFNSKQNKPLFDLVILELVKCVEILHLYRPRESKIPFINLNTITKSRGDNIAPKLLSYRNNSAHIVFGKREASLESVEKFLEIFIPYLSKTEFIEDQETQQNVVARDKKRTREIIKAAKKNHKEIFAEEILKESSKEHTSKDENSLVENTVNTIENQKKENQTEVELAKSDSLLIEKEQTKTNLIDQIYYDLFHDFKLSSDQKELLREKLKRWFKNTDK